jgi:eukaryotic-like serine/threonine-protein kinase
MTDDRIPPPEDMPDETLVARPARRVVQEERVVVPPADPDVLPGAVHEEERVGMRADGSVVREYDRLEQPPVVRTRNRWPWIIAAILLLILIGLGIWYFTRADQATVAPVVGQPVGTAVTRLEQDGFKTQITRRVSDARPDRVLEQRPAGGSQADKGATVALVVSAAPGTVTVPNAVGIPQGEARDRLVAAGFKVTSARVSSAEPTGTVVAQSPAAGEKVARGATVRINVSKGSATANVPSEVGQTSDVAQRELADKGFKPAVVQVPSDQPAGTVVAQSPAGGQAPKGSRVQLNVSKGPDATTTQTTVTAPTTTSTDGLTTTTG